MPLTWNPALNDVILLLSGLYPDKDKARFAVTMAGMDPNNIDYAGPPRVFWLRIVEEANIRDKVPTSSRSSKAISRTSISALLVQQLAHPTLPAVPRVQRRHWRGPATAAGVLEKVIGVSQPSCRSAS